MGKQVVCRGKNIKEAVSLALDVLGARKEDADIEILEYAKKGIFGIGSKPAVVRVKVNSTPAKEGVEDYAALVEELPRASGPLEYPKGLSQATDAPGEVTSSTDDDVSGKVWVHGGQIFCKDAADQYPLISPGKRITMYKNGERISNTVVITEKDAFSVEVQDDEVHEPKWEVTISGDAMRAVLSVTPGMRIRRRLADKPPSSYIELDVIEERELIVIESSPIMERLNAMGVVHGVNLGEIARACTSAQAGSFVIAQGTLPTAGSDGYFEPVKEVEVKKGLKVREDGTIDYREIQEFPSVERGQVLGIVHPPVPGLPGVSVTNHLVFPPKVFPISIGEGKGVALVENGTKVVATDSGHPDVTVKGQLVKISVIPKLVMKQDIDLQTGNVHYEGDVEIYGSVQDAMLVEARGNIVVRNNINHARVFAGVSLIVQNNVVSSEVAAGRNNLLKAQISLALGKLLEQMGLMIAAIHQLSSVSAFKVSSFTRTGLGPLMNILCEGKFKEFRPLTIDLVSKIRSGSDVLSQGWFEFADRLHRGFIHSTTSDLTSVADLQRVIEMGEGLLPSVQETADESVCFIKSTFVHNSEMYSSGDISIREGTYHSTLHAEGFIEVNGYVRGGEIYAGQGVKIEESGARGGIPTKICVSKHGTIHIGKVWEDTVIQVGQKTHTFSESALDVFARLDKHGKLLLT